MFADKKDRCGDEMSMKFSWVGNKEGAKDCRPRCWKVQGGTVHLEAGAQSAQIPGARQPAESRCTPPELITTRPASSFCKSLSLSYRVPALQQLCSYSCFQGMWESPLYPFVFISLSPLSLRSSRACTSFSQLCGSAPKNHADIVSENCSLMELFRVPHPQASAISSNTC